MITTVSADIVKSTSLGEADVRRLKTHLEEFVRFLPRYSTPKSWGRIVRGDGVECVLENVRDALRIALMLKCHIKSFNPGSSNAKFRRQGVRMAIGFGDLRTNDKKRGIIDGIAIYRSGRTLARMTQKTRGTMLIDCGDEEVRPMWEVVFHLVDALLNRVTARQANILELKLQGASELEIARMQSVSVTAIYAHLQRAEWFAIERALRFFESVYS